MVNEGKWKIETRKQNKVDYLAHLLHLNMAGAHKSTISYPRSK
jgi:hypothetical protein